MKRLTLVCLVFGFLVTIGALSVQLVNSPKASAVPARCAGIVAVGAVMPCDQPTIYAAFKAKGWTAVDDHCYTFDGTNLEDTGCDLPVFKVARCYVTAGIYGGGDMPCNNPSIMAAFKTAGITPTADGCYIFDGTTAKAANCADSPFGTRAVTAPPTPAPTPQPPATTPSSTDPEAPGLTQEQINDQARESFTSRNASVNCDGTNASGKVDQAKLKNCVAGNPLIEQFNKIVQFLTIGVGVMITIVVIIGGIQYSSARNNPQAVAAARKKIASALIAFVAYMLLWVFLQYLIPGGIIN